MLDLNMIREREDYVKQALKKKGWEVDFSATFVLVDKRKELISKVESMKAEKNNLSSSVPSIKKAGGDVEAIFAKVKGLNVQINELDEQLKSIEKQINNFVATLPNLPDDDLLPGEKENNKAVYTFGKKPEYNFKPKDHVELCESLGLIDYERAAKISGKGTWIYTGMGARLEWALLNFFISEHIADGYEFILPPYLMNYESGFTAGQFPKFEEDIFWLEGTSPRKYLLPTAETPLVNIYRNEILKEDDLPKKFFAYSACFRSEAGSYRSEERGMIRGYQFNKVEMFQYTTEDQSKNAFEELLKKAEKLVEKLGLHFQTSKLAAGDCSHSMARTYDIEVWIPSMNIYKEVSSASNAYDYQARRGNIKYRDKETGKVKYCHTLNASGLATSRLMPAIVEQFQNADGSVTVPKVLVPFMGGIEMLYPVKK